MHYSTIASAAALIATVRAVPSASTASSFNLNSTCIDSEPKVRVHNRCAYDVYLWSVVAGPGCPSGGAGAFIEQGGFYQENYRPAVGGVGTSIKISKAEECVSDELLQLEYFIETSKPGFNYNYLDVSYVNCAEDGKSCPTKSEGFYLKSGNVDGKFAANSLNNICPILSCGDFAECSKMAYVNWDDVQTKSCDPSADLDFYMCGGEAPGADTPVVVASSSAAASSAAYETPSSTSTEEEVPESTSAHASKPSSYSSAEAEVEVAAAHITSAAAVPSSTPVHVKTEFVYVTEVAYVNAKRHGHSHGHKHFRA